MNRLDDYTAWRASIPFSDDAIATVCERRSAQLSADGKDSAAKAYETMAQVVRRGVLTKKIFRHVVEELVDSCAICGRVAFYRYGTTGRCSQHKHEAPVWWEQRRVALDVRSKQAAKRIAASDRLDMLKARGRSRNRGKQQ